MKRPLLGKNNSESIPESNSGSNSGSKILDKIT